MTICVLVTLEIKSADKAQEVAQALVEYAEGYRKDQGTLDWIVTQDPKTATKFAIVERYADKGAIKTHTSNPLYPKFGRFMKDLLTAPPKITMYEELPRGSKL